VEIAPLTPERWPDLVALFERRGPRGGSGMAGSGCWCMWWRQRTGNAERNKTALRTIVKEGREPGLLAYEDGLAVGWISVEPRERLGQLMRSREYGPDEDDRAAVWSVVCFYVHASARHKGVAQELLNAAVDRALAHGATAVEAFPHNRRPDYMGSAELFERAGFRRVRVAKTRTIVRFSAGRRTARARGRAARSR
jgi:GNAT superfamily N-acetyltransferase